MSTKLNKTEQKIMNCWGYFVVSLDQPRLLKAARRLESLGLVTIEVATNDFGYSWLRVSLKEQK